MRMEGLRTVYDRYLSGIWIGGELAYTSR